MTPESLLNKVLCVWQPENAPGGVLRPKSALVGVCIAATPTEPTRIGLIPDLAVTLRGRSGKELTLSFVESRAEVFDSWHAAIHYSQTH